MPAPIDYGVQIADPTQSFLSAFQTGAGIQETRLKQEQQQQQMANQKLIQDGLTKLRQPGATVEDVSNLAMILPKDQSESVLKAWALKTDAQKQNALSRTGKVVSALFAGENDIAQQLINDEAVAMRNSGNEEGAKFLETWRGITEINPTATERFFTAQLLQLPGGDKIVENIIKLNVERRAEAQGKPTLAKLEAEAIEKGVMAEFARPIAEANLAKLNKEKLAPSVQEAIDFANLNPDQQKTFSALQVLKKPAGAVTNVNVTNLEKTAEGELGKLIPDLYNQANSAASQLGDLPRYRKALGVAITGPLANVRLDANRIGEVLGFTGDTKINATRELIQGLSEMALKSRSMLTGQGAITDREQALLLQARSGDITFSKGELDTIFNVAERAAKAQYEKSKKLLSSAATKSPTAQMFLDNVEALPGTGALNPSEQSELDALRARFPGSRR